MVTSMRLVSGGKFLFGLCYIELLLEFGGIDLFGAILLLL